MTGHSKGFGAGIGGGYKIGTNKPIKDSRGRNAAWVFLLNTLCFILYFAKYSLSLHDNLVRKKKNENSESISDDDGPVAGDDRCQRAKD